MNLLLDTHTFLWWDSNPSKLSPEVLRLCRNRTNRVFLSVVNIWEVQIKIQLGKLQLTMPLPDLTALYQQNDGFEVLPVTLDHVLALGTLPLHHKDPFDRLLIAQALVENATLVSADAAVAQYPINVLW